MKNGFKPQVMNLEGREQPGTMFSTGLDAAILTSGVLGEAIVQSSRPIMRVSEAQAKKTDAVDVAVPSQSLELNTQSAGTIKQEARTLSAVNGLFAPSAKTFASLSETGLAGGALRPAPQNVIDSRIPYNFYDGDADGVNGFTSETGTLVTDTNTWSDIRTRNSTTLTHAYGNFLIANSLGGIPLPTTANFSIRGPGVMSTGNSCLSSGTNNTTQLGLATTNTLLTPNFAFGYDLYRVEVALTTPITLLGPTHNYISLQPVGSGSGQYFIATTSGANQVGQPLAPNDDTWLTANFFGIPCENWGVVLGDTATPWEVSIGVKGTIP